MLDPKSFEAVFAVGDIEALLPRSLHGGRVDKDLRDPRETS